MGKVIGFECQPLEVLEVIVTYLTVRDLAHCLSVSRSWYNIFSNDIFWKKHCMTNSNEYFSKTTCLVEPIFKPPVETSLQVRGKRLQFLQEQHLWQNWDNGRFKKEEIVFDCDDSISYNIKVSFLDNNHVCLHQTFATEIWNVAETPSLVINIPYRLKELWEENVYKVFENLLIVIQCNVVQIYNVNIDSRSWSFNKVFFFDRLEEFSSSITSETNVDALYHRQNACKESDFERVVCGQYLVGVCTAEETPLLHIWNLKNGTKVKEDKWEICKGNYSIDLKVPRKDVLRILVTVKFLKRTNRGKPGKRCSIVYDLSQLQFITSTCQYHDGEMIYFDGYLSVLYDNPVKIIHHQSNKSAICLPESIRFVTSVQPLDNNLLICTRNQIFSVNTSEEVVQNPENRSLMKVNFDFSNFEVLFNRYILLHEVSYQSLREIWKVGKLCTKIVELPPDSGTYVASNSACSKIVLEKGNKLIILSFW